MKKVCLIFLFCIFPFFCFAQIRSQVCIVRPEYSETVIQKLQKLEDGFKKLGIANPNLQLENYLENGSAGSGFVYVAPNGTNYIITNRHIIADSETASVVFQDDVGNEVQKFTGMKVLAADGECDIAILAFPNGEKPFSSSYPVFLGNLEEDEIVYVAGYTGNLSKPMWQFTGGYVVEDSGFIEHTVPVTAGNSGGPLLRKTSVSSFEIVGLNVWSFSENKRNFALSAAYIQDFIDEAVSHNGIEYNNPEEKLYEKTMAFQTTLYKFVNSISSIMDQISIEFIEEEGNAIYNSIYFSLSDNSRKTMKAIYMDYSPVACVRYAMACYISQEFSRGDYNFSIDPELSEEDLPEVPVPFEDAETGLWNTSFYLPVSNSYAKSEWVYNYGDWELYSFKKVSDRFVDDPITRLTDKGISKKSFVRDIPNNGLLYTPNLISLSYGACPFSIDEENFLHVADIEVKLLNFLAIDITGLFNERMSYIYYMGNTYSRVSYTDIFGGVQFQFPFTSQSLILMPYVTVQGGVQLIEFKMSKIEPLGRVEAGGRINFFIGKSDTTVFLDANCQMIIDFKKFQPRIDFGISAGLSF